MLSPGPFEYSNSSKISLQPLVRSFEILAKEIMKISLSPRIEERRKNLVHPVHQQLAVFSWEVLGKC